MGATTAQELAEFRQSIWLDNISRDLISSGTLKGFIDQGLLGMTSNPTIFDNAISKTNDYDKDIRELHQSGKSCFEIYDDLTIKDIQDVAELLKPIYEKTDGFDGYVSLEINPKLAQKTQETIDEGRRLFKKVNRPNVLFKVPSTDEGFPAIEEFIADGMNINITLIFSLDQYSKSAHSYIRGLKRRVQSGNDITGIRSVASVFVSRIDAAVDKKLDVLTAQTADTGEREALASLKGKAAVENSRIIYKKYQDIFLSDEFKDLARQGAKIQRVLWASTGTKDPSYSDIKYVTELIAPDTVNTMPDKTFTAFLDHGKIQDAHLANSVIAQAYFAELEKKGIFIDAVTKELLEKGIASFEQSFDSLLKSISEKANIICKT